MTMSALRTHPKVYWIWNHRRWCLENIPNGPGGEGESDFSGWRKGVWEKEMIVLEKMQETDPRNCEWIWNDIRL
jgi:geranylgeranyl transferase type-2 subunit alpha